MLLKLIRYEFKCNYSKFLAACLVNLFIVAVFSLIPFKSSVAPFTVSLVSLIAFNIVGFIFIFQRYVKNLYSNEGYLTFTLPVRSYELLFSKLLIACLWLIIFSIISIPNMCLIVYSLDNSYLMKVFKIISSEVPTSLFTTINFIVGTFLNMLIVYFAISVSKLSIWRKFGTLMGFITFFAINVIASIPPYILSKYSAAVSQKSKFGDISYKFLQPNRYTLIELLFCISIGVLLFFLTCYILDNKTNLK